MDTETIKDKQHGVDTKEKNSEFELPPKRHKVLESPESSVFIDLCDELYDEPNEFEDLALNKIKNSLQTIVGSSLFNTVSSIKKRQNALDENVLKYVDDLKNLEERACIIVNQYQEQRSLIQQLKSQNLDNRSQSFFANLKDKATNGTVSKKPVSQIVFVPDKSSKTKNITGPTAVAPPKTPSSSSISSVNADELISNYMNILDINKIPIAALPQSSDAYASQHSLNLSMMVTSNGIELKWHYPVSVPDSPQFFEIFQYNTRNLKFGDLSNSAIWTMMGRVNALPLPMICTLDSCEFDLIYYFVVRPIDTLGRPGPWSNIVVYYCPNRK
ncbi:hypothetical protein Ciccas_007685 [Cichlidogyrus casuarinus]|uniref:Activating transcription factor 7-interacting protein Fn3 domain-containing protein n=1 Tax=Cichlidogyrus casuarinus TaxID=1844966 RepID=A0ABD2Q2Y4_9PLAT